MLGEIERFLTAVPAEPELERVLVTLLLVELLDAAEQAALLGDHGWRQALDAFRTAAQLALSRFRGKELDPAGRSLQTRFDGPARAIRCARSIVDAAGSLGLRVRAGLHTGECELLEQRVRGLAFHIAERVTEHGGAGDVVVTGTVKDLVAGSGIQFEDLGAHPLAGIPGEWRLFRVAPEPPADGTGLAASARTPSEQSRGQPEELEAPPDPASQRLHQDILAERFPAEQRLPRSQAASQPAGRVEQAAGQPSTLGVSAV
jgi:class 3 adenylate cyclase